MPGPRPADREHWNILSVTAHRDIHPSDVQIIVRSMQSVVKRLEVDALYFGGARGGDTVALRAALHFRKEKRPCIVVVVPDTVERQPVQTREHIRRADEVIQLHNQISSVDHFRSYLIRDAYLVDIASSLLAFYSGDRKSGTGRTVAMAERDGLIVEHVSIQGRGVGAVLHGSLGRSKG